MLLDEKCVVYKIPCNSCNSCYVGQTKRALGIRLKEHKNYVIDGKQHLPVYCHLERTGHTMDWDNVAVLDTEANWKSRLVSEMAHIHLQESALNSVNDTKLRYNINIYCTVYVDRFIVVIFVFICQCLTVCTGEHIKMYTKFIAV